MVSGNLKHLKCPMFNVRIIFIRYFSQDSIFIFNHIDIGVVYGANIAVQNTALIKYVTEIHSLEHARNEEEADRGRRPKKRALVKDR